MVANVSKTLLMQLIYIFIGGGIGSVTRFAFSLFFLRTQISLPVATLLANVLSCVIFALTWIYFGEKEIFSSIVKPILLIGFCGGLSTFSTFSFETFELLKRGEYVFAGVNILLNMILCLTIFTLFARK